MHELSICSAIAGTATDHAGGRRVDRIRLRIGHFRQVVPETLAHSWTIHTTGTSLSNCKLDVTYIPAVIHCEECDTDTTLDSPILRCNQCGEIRANLISGEEFLIESIDVAEEVG